MQLSRRSHPQSSHLLGDSRDQSQYTWVELRESPPRTLGHMYPMEVALLASALALERNDVAAIAIAVVADYHNNRRIVPMEDASTLADVDRLKAAGQLDSCRDE